jgi:hypothetical protein
MSATVREIVIKAINTLLDDTIVVSGDTIPFYTDYFGDAASGIYIQSYLGESDDSKHFYAQNITIEIAIFGRGKSLDYVAEITRKVILALKASVLSTIQLSDGYQATYSLVPSLSSFTDFIDGQTTHRDILRVQLRVDEISN